MPVFAAPKDAASKLFVLLRRYDLVIATKVRGMMGEGPNDVGLSRKLQWKGRSMGISAQQHLSKFGSAHSKDNDLFFVNKESTKR
jgi:hypothetical protein